MKTEIVLEIEFVSDPGDDDAIDAWTWALERQVEEMALVQKAEVVTATFKDEA